MDEQLNVAKIFVFGTLFIGVLSTGVATADNAERSQVIYEQTCVACHGADGRGTLPGVPDFTSTSGPLSKPDALLLENVINGFQSPDSMMAMPPKGGNSDLTEEDIKIVIQYIREKYGT